MSALAAAAVAVATVTAVNGHRARSRFARGRACSQVASDTGGRGR